MRGGSRALTSNLAIPCIHPSCLHKLDSRPLRTSTKAPHDRNNSRVEVCWTKVLRLSQKLWEGRTEAKAAAHRQQSPRSSLPFRGPIIPLPPLTADDPDSSQCGGRESRMRGMGARAAQQPRSFSAFIRNTENLICHMRWPLSVRQPAFSSGLGSRRYVPSASHQPSQPVKLARPLLRGSSSTFTGWPYSAPYGHSISSHTFHVNCRHHPGRHTTLYSPQPLVGTQTPLPVPGPVMQVCIVPAQKRRLQRISSSPSDGQRPTAGRLYVSQALIAENLLNKAIFSPAAADPLPHEPRCCLGQGRAYDENNQSQSSAGQPSSYSFDLVRISRL